MIDIDGALDFNAMQARLNPVESRIRKLSSEIPARLVAFDTLVRDGVPPLEGRSSSGVLRSNAAPAFALSPSVSDPASATAWLDELWSKPDVIATLLQGLYDDTGETT